MLSLGYIGFSLQVGVTLQLRFSWWLPLFAEQLLQDTGFGKCGSQAPEHRLSSCGAWAEAPIVRAIFLYQESIEPESSALA